MCAQRCEQFQSYVTFVKYCKIIFPIGLSNDIHSGLDSCMYTVVSNYMCASFVVLWLWCLPSYKVPSYC